MVSNYTNNEGDNKLYKEITENFDVSTNVNIERNDSYYLNIKGIDSEVVSTCPSIGDYSHFENCHTIEDSLDTINVSDMEKFVLNFLKPLTK